jgi:hypothetical protein
VAAQLTEIYLVPGSNTLPSQPTQDALYYLLYGWLTGLAQCSKSLYPHRQLPQCALFHLRTLYFTNLQKTPQQEVIEKSYFAPKEINSQQRKFTVPSVQHTSRLRFCNYYFIFSKDSGSSIFISTALLLYFNFFYCGMLFRAKFAGL